MEFQYINEQEVTERLTKDRARAAIQMICFAKFAGQEPDENWVAEWERLQDTLTPEETQQFIDDVERAVLTEKETSIIQARVEGRDDKHIESEVEAVKEAIVEAKAAPVFEKIAVAVEAAKVKPIDIESAPVEPAIKE